MKDMSVEHLSQTLPPRDPVSRQGRQSGTNADFSSMLLDSIKEVNRLQVASNKAIEELAAGRRENIHETMIAIEKASISFQMMMQIRNKIIEAYDQLMKTSL